MVSVEKRSALKSIKILDVQWSDCPEDVEKEVRKLCENEDYGNDNYIFKWGFDPDDETYPIIAQYLRDNGVGEDEEVWINWW